MMHMKHTPGFWSSEPVWNIPETKVHAYCQGRAYALAEVYSMPEPGEREANAKLIAAAPELLEALEDLRDAIRGGWDISVAMSKANATLAKAVTE
jgi:hypothetical protein